jgi:ribokinase
MHNNPEFIALGDVVTDAFIRLNSKDAEVKECIDHHRQELSLSFGDKVPYEFVKIVRGVGNSANAAVAAARLGLHSSLIADVGADLNGKECLQELEKNKVSTKLMSIHNNLETNYHYVLWYDVERTILVKHQEYPYKLPRIKTSPQWLYLSSLGGNSLPYHQEILAYLLEHEDVKLAFQPGTYQMKFGTEALQGIYARAHLFFCNVEESQRILKTEETDIKKLLRGIADLGPRIVFITDGIKGAYAYDGTDMWFMPVYPQDPYERTGAGDAFASTVTAALALGKSVEEALMWGPINSASVVQKVGAQEGLLSQEELLLKLKNAPADYKPKKI